MAFSTTPAHADGLFDGLSKKLGALADQVDNKISDVNRSSEQREGRIWTLKEAKDAWNERFVGNGTALVYPTLVPNLFAYRDSSEQMDRYFNPQQGWVFNSGRLQAFWQKGHPLDETERKKAIAAVFDDLVKVGTISVDGGDSRPDRLVLMALGNDLSAQLARKLDASRTGYRLLPTIPRATTFGLGPRLAITTALCSQDPGSTWKDIMVRSAQPKVIQCADAGNLLDIWQIWATPGQPMQIPASLYRDGSVVDATKDLRAPG
jgi:hypothetical protein